MRRAAADEDPLQEEKNRQLVEQVGGVVHGEQENHVFVEHGTEPHLDIWILRPAPRGWCAGAWVVGGGGGAHRRS